MLLTELYFSARTGLRMKRRTTKSLIEEGSKKCKKIFWWEEICVWIVWNVRIILDNYFKTETTINFKHIESPKYIKLTFEMEISVIVHFVKTLVWIYKRVFYRINEMLVMVLQ